MKRKLLFTLLAALLCPGFNQAAEKPNFLFIITDDQAPNTIRALGNTEIITPNLDRLVKQGTTFTHCFNQGSWSGAVCVASRTMLITGQTVYRAPENKVYIDAWGQARGPLSVEKETAVKLWPEVFRDAAYRTFLTGKWHNSHAAILQGFTDGKAVGSGFYNTFEFAGQKSKDNPGYNRPTPENNSWNPWDPKFHGHWNPAVLDITGNGEMSEPYDHSIRIPFIISGPGIPAGKQIDDMIYMQSVYPTTCELAGLEIPSSVEFASVKELATGEKDNGGEGTIFGTYLTFQRMVRTETHKLIYYPNLDCYQLFDMVEDPDEITDLSDEAAYSNVKQNLIEELNQKRKHLGDGLLK